MFWLGMGFTGALIHRWCLVFGDRAGCILGAAVRMCINRLDLTTGTVFCQHATAVSTRFAYNAAYTAPLWQSTRSSHTALPCQKPTSRPFWRSTRSSQHQLRQHASALATMHRQRRKLASQLWGRNILNQLEPALSHRPTLTARRASSTLLTALRHVVGLAEGSSSRTRLCSSREMELNISTAHPSCCPGKCSEATLTRT
jgi:hypothetical protein